MIQDTISEVKPTTSYENWFKLPPEDQQDIKTMAKERYLAILFFVNAYLQTRVS